MNFEQLKDIPLQINNYVDLLKKDNKFEFNPSLYGLTKVGKKLNLGFSNYGLKIKYMLGELNSETLVTNWVDYINSYQQTKKHFPKNSFIDPAFLNGYKFLGFKDELKFNVKNFTNIFLNKNFDTKRSSLVKAVNAETKQSISTLYQVGFKNKYKLEQEYKDFKDLEIYLNSLNWSQPWSAGAQFSSMCVYSATQEFNYSEKLYKYITFLLDENTGSYFSKTPSSSRQVINGAMKVITGLDWIGQEVHSPEKLIDFCLSNIPVSEGCDIVDYVYVLYKCSNQTIYKKKEINDVFKIIIEQLLKLYNVNDNAFSYYQNKSQTHYYGLKITDGTNNADLHGSLLSLWAIFMMMENMEILDSKFKIIKP